MTGPVAQNTAVKYLSRFAEPLVAQAQALATEAFEHCLVIPCFNEQPGFAEQLMRGPLWQQNMLVIVVINQPNAEPHRARQTGYRPALVTADNKNLLGFFQQFPKVAQTPDLCVCQPSGDNSAWLVIDACTSLAPAPKQGVGLARKIGCDVAVALWQQAKISSPWLHCTDADAKLPCNYFDLPAPEKQNSGGQYSGAYYNFTHIEGDAPAMAFKATQLYESAIVYYAKSLRWATSPYAFTALGSAIAVGFESYCKVRGFPKKSAGEDFYLLNKLAKVGLIYSAPQVIEIQTRTSQRVPFGTGPATQTIIEQLKAGDPYRYYHPKCFVALRHWLEFAQPLALSIRATRSDGGCDAEALLAGLPLPAAQALHAIGISELLNHLKRQAKSQNQATKAIHDWFDGFKTLKFIHHLQAHHYPACSLANCLEGAVYHR